MKTKPLSYYDENNRKLYWLTLHKKYLSLYIYCSRTHKITDIKNISVSFHKILNVLNYSYQKIFLMNDKLILIKNCSTSDSIPIYMIDLTDLEITEIYMKPLKSYY